MRAASRRNLVALGLGVLFLLLLWQVPGRRAPAAGSATYPGTPRPTPTAETLWRPLHTFEVRGARDFCSEGLTVTVPGPWRVRATPADRTVRVRIIDRRDGSLFAQVWAGGSGHGSLATLPQGNGTFCLQAEAEGDYTLTVEAWQAPEQ
mgnify:CR=1 FL=1